MDNLESARELLQDIVKDKNILYIIAHAHIGDLILVGGLCHALRERKHKQSCTIITYERFKNCGIHFADVNEMQYISNSNMSLLRHYFHATREYETDDYVYGHIHKKKNFEGKYVSEWNKRLSMLNRFKENVFDLPLDTELLSPIIAPLSDEQNQRLHETYILDKKRTIIFAPYALSTKNLEESLWIEIIAELKCKNSEYVFYTNVASLNEKIIPGTAPIVTTFPELTYIAEKVNCFIGLRSGIFDLLAFTNAKLLCVITATQWWRYDLALNFNHTNSRTFCYIISPEQARVIQAFMEKNNIRSLEELPLYNHIKGTDIFFDMESLIKAIVDSVD